MIGILGGTFDPVHLGHLSIARQVQTALDLGAMQLMPCFEPVHRDPSRRSATQRLEMLRLALADCPELTLNTMEIDRGGPSFTVDSLQTLRAEFAGSLAFVIGSDAFNGFDGWREPDRILELANLIVCYRPGVDINVHLYESRQTRSIDVLKAATHGKILLLPVDENPCSSTSIRKSLERGDSPGDCLPPSVLHYIAEQNLYRSQSA